MNEINNEKNTNETEVGISILDILQSCLKRWWMILGVAILAAILMFVYIKAFTNKQYQASAMMYVNNSSLSVGGTKIDVSMGDINAAQSLVDVYCIIIRSRLTLEEVIDVANLPYTYEGLYSMISVSSVDETEIFKITVTSGDPVEAANIANTIVEIFPSKVASIIDGTSAKIVDLAVVPLTNISQNYLTKMILAFAIGLILSAAVSVLLDIIDDRLESSDWVKQNYGDAIPLLAVIPDSSESSSGSYYNKYGYGYGYGYYKKDYTSKPVKDEKEKSKK